MDEDHVASNKTCGIGTTPSVRLRVEHHWAITVGRVAQNLMEMDRKPVQMTYVEWTEVCMERVIKQGIIDREIHGASPLPTGGVRLGSRRALAWRLRLLGRIREWSSRIRCVVIRSQIKTIWFARQLACGL